MNRHTFQNLLSLSTLLILSLVTGSDVDQADCAAFVEDPSSILGVSGYETAPNVEYLVSGMQQCISQCCSLGPPCTIGLFISETIDDETNCLLYDCDPLSACSVDVWEGVQVFVNKRFIESSDVNTSLPSSPSPPLPSSPSPPLSSSPSSVGENSADSGGGASTELLITPSQTTSTYELPTSSLGSNPDLSNPDLSNSDLSNPDLSNPDQDQDFYDSNDILNALGKLFEGNAESANANSSLSPSTVSLAPDRITSSLLQSDIINTTVFNSDRINDILLPSAGYSSTTSLPADGITPTLLPSNTVTAVLLPYNKNTKVSVPTGSSSTSSPPYDGISKTIVIDNGTPIIAPASSLSSRLAPVSSTLALSSSVTYSSSLASLDDVTASIGFTEAGAPSEVISVSPTRFEPDSPTSEAPSHHQLHNATRFKDEDGGQEGQSGATTAVLVISVTLGSVFLLVVVGVLGVRFWEGYKKRHYSRLDYLVNGMYS